MSIFRNVVLNLQTEEECERAINLYKEQLSSLTNSGVWMPIFVVYQKSQFFFLQLSTQKIMLKKYLKV